MLRRIGEGNIWLETREIESILVDSEGDGVIIRMRSGDVHLLTGITIEEVDGLVALANRDALPSGATLASMTEKLVKAMVKGAQEVGTNIGQSMPVGHYHQPPVPAAPTTKQ